MFNFPLSMCRGIMFRFFPDTGRLLFSAFSPERLSGIVILFILSIRIS